MSGDGLSRFLVVLALAACQSGPARASDTARACLIHLDAESAIACYRQVIEGMKHNTAWCQGLGLKELQELQSNIGKSLNHVLEHRRKTQEAEVAEFGSQANQHVKDMQSTADPVRKSQIAARWYQFVEDHKRKKDANKASKELKKIHKEFGELQSEAGRLDCR